MRDARPATVPALAADLDGLEERLETHETVLRELMDDAGRPDLAQVLNPPKRAFKRDMGPSPDFRSGYQAGMEEVKRAPGAYVAVEGLRQALEEAPVFSGPHAEAERRLYERRMHEKAGAEAKADEAEAVWGRAVESEGAKIGAEARLQIALRDNRILVEQRDAASKELGEEYARSHRLHAAYEHERDEREKLVEEVERLERQVKNQALTIQEVMGEREQLRRQHDEVSRSLGSSREAVRQLHLRLDGKEERIMSLESRHQEALHESSKRWTKLQHQGNDLAEARTVLALVWDRAFEDRHSLHERVMKVLGRVPRDGE